MDREKLLEVNRYLGSLPKRKLHDKTCPVCGVVFKATARGKFCSAKCRSRDQVIRARRPGLAPETPDAEPRGSAS